MSITNKTKGEIQRVFWEKVMENEAFFNKFNEILHEAADEVKANHDYGYLSEGELAEVIARGKWDLLVNDETLGQYHH